jgi:hypothetical protein
LGVDRVEGMDYDVDALKRQALETPDLFRDVFSTLQGKVIPPKPFKNILIRNFHLDKSDADACYKILTQNIEELGLADKTVQGKPYLRLDKLGTALKSVPQEAETEEEGAKDVPKIDEALVTVPKATPCPPPRANQIFVIHGKKHSAP